MEPDFYLRHLNIAIPDRSAIYMFIPKVACTSIKTMLARHLMLSPPLGMARHVLLDKSEPVHRIDFPNIDREGLFAGEYADWFAFAFVRSPFDRLVSCYVDKIRWPGYKRGNFKNGIYGGFDRFNRETGERVFYPSMSFDRFVAAVCEIGDDIADDHIRSQYSYLHDAEGKCIPKFVGKFESLDHDLGFVRDRLQLEWGSPPKLKATRRRDFREYYNAKLMRQVGQRYERDLDAFQYASVFQPGRTFSTFVKTLRPKPSTKQRRQRHRQEKALRSNPNHCRELTHTSYRQLGKLGKTVDVVPVKPVGPVGSVEHYFHFVFGVVCPLSRVFASMPESSRVALRPCGPFTDTLHEIFGDRVVIDSALADPTAHAAGLKSMHPGKIPSTAAELEACKSDIFSRLGVRPVAEPDTVLLIDRGEALPFYKSGTAERPTSGSERRSIENYKQFVGHLSEALDDRWQVRSVQLESMPFAEQLQLFDRSALVIAQHGAALSNCLWMRPGTRVVEIRTQSNNRTFKRLCLRKGIGHKSFVVAKEHVRVDLRRFRREIVGDRDLSAFFRRESLAELFASFIRSVRISFATRFARGR